MDDLYKVLGVPKTATASQIKKAYRDAAFKYHPDRNPNNKVAEEKFKELNAAYAVLGDESKRAQYDRFGSADSYAQSQRNSYAQSQHGESSYEDSFWDWYQQQTTGQRYRQTYSAKNEKSWHTDPKNKKEAFLFLLRNVGIVIFCIYILPWTVILFPIGPIFCILGLFRAAMGAVQAIQILLKPKKN